MTTKIKADVLQALDDWKAGKPVKSIELGHVHRMTHSEEHMASYPNTRNPIDLSKRVSNDQERAHAYCFDILERISGMTQPPADYDTFLNGWCIAAAWRKHHMENQGLTLEEAAAAESLAWKALNIGWARAIAGHAPEMYIEVRNPSVVSAT